MKGMKGKLIRKLKTMQAIATLRQGIIIFQLNPETTPNHLGDDDIQKRTGFLRKHLKENYNGSLDTAAMEHSLSDFEESYNGSLNSELKYTTTIEHHQVSHDCGIKNSSLSDLEQDYHGSTKSELSSTRFIKDTTTMKHHDHGSESSPLSGFEESYHESLDSEVKETTTMEHHEVNKDRGSENSSLSDLEADYHGSSTRFFKDTTTTKHLDRGSESSPQSYNGGFDSELKDATTMEHNDSGSENSSLSDHQENYHESTKSEPSSTRFVEDTTTTSHQSSPLSGCESECNSRTLSGKSSAVWGFEEKCPPGGGDKVVLYTTSLRGIRKTFEDCVAVRFLLESHKVSFSERDISLHREFREELWEMFGGTRVVPPRLFIKGRYVGGAETVVGLLNERGQLGILLEGLPRVPSPGSRCPGCANIRFSVCFTCHGSRKILTLHEGREPGRVRCPECNENGLVKCEMCC